MPQSLIGNLNEYFFMVNVFSLNKPKSVSRAIRGRINIVSFHTTTSMFSVICVLRCTWVELQRLNLRI
jgi:hypothetical protein